MKLSGLVGLLSLILLVPSAASAQEDRVVPVVSGFSLSNHVFTVGPAPTPRFAQRPTGRPEGTTMRYTLSEDASVYFGIQRWRPGLLRGGRCQPVTRAKGHRLRRRQPGRRCIALKPIAIFTRSGVAGANSFLFSGRIGTHPLRPGRFDVGVDAIDAAGNSSFSRTSSFRVVRRG